MANVKELEAQLRQLQTMLEAHGIRAPVPPAEKPTDRADYVEFGSDEHAAFLGLVPAEQGDEDHITHTSPRTKKTYCLEDEVTQFMHYPDPKQVAGLVLQQKVNVLESTPEVSDTAPPMWRPLDVPV